MLRVGFVTGATPDRWARAWRERHREGLHLVPLEDPMPALRSGDLDMALVRLPVDREGLHVIALYDEQPVAVVSREHYLSLATSVTLDDLAEEQLVAPHPSGWAPSTDQLAWPPMSDQDAIETVAAGTGVVIVPMSVARLFHRKDVVAIPVEGLEPTTVGLAWLREHDDERTQAFVGVVRGRSANSSRS